MCFLGTGFEGGAPILKPGRRTAAVRASQDISPWGVIGLAGNVSEWIADWYFPGYNNLGTLNPTGPSSQPLTDPGRVVRGGSFYDLAAYARSGHRLTADPRSAADWIGFRCAMEVSGAVTPPTPTPDPRTATLPASITPTPTETPVP
jgi:formylglycine-generating enzyme required for sulfatase activity